MYQAIRFAPAILVLTSLPLFGQVPFTQFVVFGDSLSDNGNYLVGTTLLGDPQPVAPGYATGEYTDGVNSVPSTSNPLGLWIEQLARGMNLPAPQPYAKGGFNYATASAQTGTNPAYAPGKPTVPWSTDQVDVFLATVHTPPVDYLYTFWCGSDDIFAGVNPATAVSNVQANINTLANAGAKYFLWVNLAPLGEIPQYINTSQRAAMDAAAVAYNTAWTTAIAQLMAAHPGITIAAFDVHSGMEEYTQNPSLYGFVNVTSPAQGLANVNPNTYLFWDMVHPTTAGHAGIADGAYNAIASAFGGLPLITSVVNAFGNSSTIAANTWVAVKGSVLSAAGDSRTWQGSDFVNGQMPSAVDGVSVTMNGEKTYVYYISPTQLNILTPPDLAPGPVLVQATANGRTSAAFLVESQTLSTSFFAFDGTHVVAQHVPSYTDVGPTTLYAGLTTPAQPGEEVVLYANGFGPTSATVVAGSAAQSGTLSPLPVVTIGGVQANVLFAGLVGVGLFQFNVIVPPSTPNGDIPLVATYNGATTQSDVVITVQQ
jgi:uncharacterized protein (TIGR03437 family)